MVFFGSTEKLIKVLDQKVLNELLEETNVLRENAGRPKARMITDKGILSVEHFKAKKLKIREIKILQKTINKPTGFCFYGDRVGVYSVASMPFGAIIESEEIADLVREMFKIIWESLK